MYSPRKGRGRDAQRLQHPLRCTDSSLNMLKLANQLVINWTVTAVVCNSSAGWKASYSLAGFPGLQASTTATSSKCRVGKRCTWSSCEWVRAAVFMCCMCHWYKSLLWNHSSLARSVRAFLSTFSVSVHGTLPVVLYTDRHSHRKDVPESISSLGVCSPFFW